MPLRTATTQMLHDARTGAAAATTAQLKYYGGPVLQNVKVQIVYWGGAAKVAGAGQLEKFYTAITNSPYFDWLTEYNTSSPAQKIGRGSFISSVDATGAKIGSISDSDIQTQLTSMINGGKLDTKDPANTIYMVHFPPGMSISQGGSSSCVQFCAYHGTFSLGGHYVYYGVIPDQAADGCGSGCGNGQPFDNTTSTSSHELIEAVTDAAVGLATTAGPPLAWYDQQQGEIGDICVVGTSYTGVVAGFTVQKEWSNKNKSCITTDGSSPPPPPPPTNDDFGIALDSASYTVAAGARTQVKVSTTRTGNAETVTLSATGLPSGVTASFSPASVSSGGSSTLTLTASANAAAASVSFTVTGDATSGSHSASASLDVTTSSPPPPPPQSDDFSVSVAGGAANVKPGGSTTLTVSTAVVSGSPGKIALSVAGLPSGVSGSFSPTSVAAGGSSTLTLSADASAAPGSSKLTITGTAGGTSHSDTANLTVSGNSPPPPPPHGGDLIANGDFEGGATGWQRGGNALITTKAFHGGSHSALVGTSGSYYGESGLYQKVAVPASGSTTLSFWHLNRCRDDFGGSFTAAYVADESGNILDTVYEGCQIDSGWTSSTADLSDYAGSNVLVYFYAYDVGWSDMAAWSYIDDVSVTNQ
jgi:hypothetical protein